MKVFTFATAVLGVLLVAAAVAFVRPWLGLAVGGGALVALGLLTDDGAGG